MREKRSVGEWLSVVVCFFQKKSKKKLPEQLLLCRIQWSLEVKQSTVCTIVLHFFFFLSLIHLFALWKQSKKKITPSTEKSSLLQNNWDVVLKPNDLCTALNCFEWHHESYEWYCTKSNC